MKNRILIFFVFFLLPIIASAHKYYVSIATMEYNATDQRIEVSLKMTGHDFEYLLEMKYGRRVHLEEVADSSETGLYIQQYLRENFEVSSAGKTLEQVYLGKEITVRDELFFYLTFNGVEDPKTIQIKNQLLFTLFAQQQNIVHYKNGEQTKSVTLVPSAPSAEIKTD